MDKLTGDPVRTNNLIIRIVREDEPIIEFFADNIGEYRVEIPVGAEAELLVEATGYHDWELVVRPKAAKYLEGPVEPIPVDSTKKMNGL